MKFTRSEGLLLVNLFVIHAVPPTPTTIIARQRDTRYSNPPIVSRRATCDDSQFHFYIEFAAPFGGKIYTRNTPECTYVNADIPVKSQGGIAQKLFNISLPLSTNCGSEVTRSNDYEEYSIRMNVDPIPNADGTQGFILVCRQRRGPATGSYGNTLPPTGPTGGGGYGGQTPGTSYVTSRPYTLPSIPPTISYEPSPPTSQYGVTPTSVYRQPPRSESTYSITAPREENLQHTVNLDATSSVQFSSSIVLGPTSAGPQVTRTVELGERLTYVFRCATNDGAARDCGVGVCFAKGETGNTVQLTDANGCSLHPMFWDNFRRDGQPSTGGSQYSASFWAWGLHSDVHLIISCALQVCAQQCLVGRNCGATSVDANSIVSPTLLPSQGPPGLLPNLSPTTASKTRRMTLQRLRAAHARRLHDDIDEDVEDGHDFVARSSLSLQTAALYEVTPKRLSHRSVVSIEDNEDCIPSSTVIVMATAWLATLIAPLALASWMYTKLRAATHGKMVR